VLVYDLICSPGHHCEGWFKSLEDVSSLLSRNFLACPVCGDGQISRRPSTFGLVKTNRPEPPPAPASPETPGELHPVLEMLKKLADFSSRLEREFDDVGSNFTAEALKMHYGVSERRNIRGHSTEPQEALLREEGVDFFKVPVLTRKNSPPTN
jgi:hypothetical protein